MTMNIKTLLLFALLLLTAFAASAQQQYINFECCNQQVNPHIGVANFTGGFATPTLYYLGAGTQGVMYFTRPGITIDAKGDPCTTCSNQMVITFDKEVSNFSFSLGNGVTHQVIYKIETDNGPATTQTLAPNETVGSWAIIRPQGNNFKRVVITSPLFSGVYDGVQYNNSFWDFAIDDMYFTVTPADTRMVFGLVDTPGADPVVKTLPRPNGTSTTFPLGARFFFRVEKL